MVADRNSRESKSVPSPSAQSYPVRGRRYRVLGEGGILDSEVTARVLEAVLDGLNAGAAQRAAMWSLLPGESYDGRTWSVLRLS